MKKMPGEPKPEIKLNPVDSLLEQAKAVVALHNQKIDSAKGQGKFVRGDKTDVPDVLADMVEEGAADESLANQALKKLIASGEYKPEEDESLPLHQPSKKCGGYCRGGYRYGVI